MIDWEALYQHVTQAYQIQAMSTKTIEEDLKDALQPMFSHFAISVHPFGSRFMGLANPKSDLDIYVKCYAEFIEYARPPTKMVLQNLELIANGIKKSKNCRFLRKLSMGNCPIIIAKHLQTNIIVDISLINEMTFKQNVLMNYMLDLQPIARYMAIYLRYLRKEEEIPESFRSFILYLLVIYYLQIIKELPSVQKLLNNQSQNPGRWITNFNRYNLSKFSMHKIEPNAQSVKLYLQGFFKFYANFNYKELVICPYLGDIVTRSQISEQMPDIFRETFKGKIWSSPMEVQDLIYLTQNKSKSISLMKLHWFKESCRLLSTRDPFCTPQ